MACNDVVCGTGGWNGPLPGDPDNNLVLTASPAFGGIDVTWTYPLLNPEAVAHTLLYRATTPNYLNAINIGVAAGNFFYDKTTAAVTTRYYYWIRVVSVNGTVGELIGPASAIARLTIEQTIEDLTGKIDKSVLGMALKEEIGTISLLGNSITQEVQNRLAANTALGQVITDLDGKVHTAMTLVESEVRERISADSAVVTSLTLMASNFDASIAGLAEEIILETGPTSAIAKKITTLEATVGGSTVTGQIGLTAKVDAATGVVSGLYTAKLSAPDPVTGQRLIGGFGLANDGSTVDAGFDVDTFWVGRTNINKRKPFIVNSLGETIINDAVIEKLTFTKLRSADGSVMVENGKIKADYIDTKGLEIKDNLGNVILSSGSTLSSQIFNRIGGGNLIPNSDLMAGASGWQMTWNQKGGTNYVGPVIAIAGQDYEPAGGKSIGVSRSGITLAASGYFDISIIKNISVLPNTRYELSAYLASHKCPVGLLIVYLDSTGKYIDERYIGRVGTNNSGGKNLADWERVGDFFTLPTNCTQIRIGLRGSAAKSADPYYWGTRFFLAQAGTMQTELSPWSAGGSGGAFSELDLIDPSNISTYIAGAAIGSAQIGDAAITTAKIGALEVNTLNIANYAVSVPVGQSGYGSIPVLTIVLNEPGTIFVTVMANAIATGGGNAGNLYVSASCNGNLGPTVGISMADGYAGSATAIGTFKVGAGTHSVSGAALLAHNGQINRIIAVTGIFSIGVKR